MKTYEMRTQPKEYERVHTSKGNQLKWRQDGYWYKADQFGYEGVAETVVSLFLKLSGSPFPYVSYEQAAMRYEGNVYTGCRSRDFYETNPGLSGFELVPLERLHRQYTGLGLAKHLAQLTDAEPRVSYTVDFVRNVTGLEQFPDYLSFLIQADAFFLNEDRHTNNLAVMWNPKSDVYAYCPYFDFGLSLFADIKDAFPLTMDYASCRKEVKAKPFSTDFDEQLDACEKRGSAAMKFPFRVLEMRNRAEKMLMGMECDESIKSRIIDTLAAQANKYQYLFL